MTSSRHSSCVCSPLQLHGPSPPLRDGQTESALNWRLEPLERWFPAPERQEWLLAELGETICPYCGVGCRLRLEGSGCQVSRVRGVEEAPANLGRICAKGAQLGPTIDTPDRLARPQLRLDRQSPFRPVDIDTALSHVAGVFGEIIKAHGPEAVAFYGSGQLDSETVYLAGKLFKGHL